MMISQKDIRDHFTYNAGFKRWLNFLGHEAKIKDSQKQGLQPPSNTHRFQSIYLEKNICRFISSPPFAPRRLEGSL
jgi:hypothetical protein